MAKQTRRAVRRRDVGGRKSHLLGRELGVVPARFIVSGKQWGEPDHVGGIEFW